MPTVGGPLAPGKGTAVDGVGAWLGGAGKFPAGWRGKGTAIWAETGADAAKATAKLANDRWMPRILIREFYRDRPRAERRLGYNAEGADAIERGQIAYPDVAVEFVGRLHNH